MPELRDPAAPASRASLYLALLGCALVEATGCAKLRVAQPGAPQEFSSTYQKHLARAELGDAESQNVVGFMLYHGEGVATDQRGASTWFERAAIAGSERAKRNLARMTANAGTSATSPERGPTVTPRTRASGDGERLYARYCGGCHGFNGIAFYQHAPSFALGERLDRPDAELMRSLREGHAAMPSWEDKLPQHDLNLILAAVRRLPARYDAGVDASMNATPEYFYLFGPMETR